MQQFPQRSNLAQIHISVFVQRLKELLHATVNGVLGATVQPINCCRPMQELPQRSKFALIGIHLFLQRLKEVLRARVNGVPDARVRPINSCAPLISLDIVSALIGRAHFLIAPGSLQCKSGLKSRSKTINLNHLVQKQSQSATDRRPLLTT